MLRSFRKNRKMVRLAVVGMIIFALAAPALAEHFDWNTFLTGEPDPTVMVTAEDAHVECPEAESEEGDAPEGATETVEDDEEAADATADCDKAVQEAAADLQAYDHPENHGKYVSFVAHCLKGMKGKGQVMRQIAHADEDEQQEMAVRLCAEWKLAQAEDADEDAVESRGKKNKDDSASDDDADEVSDDDDSDDDEGAGSESKPAKAKNRGKGKGRR